MKQSLYFILALSLLACQPRNDSRQSQTDTSPIVTDSVAVTGAAATEPAKPATPDSAYLIVPGQSIGQVKLQMPAAAVTNILGKSDSGDAAMGKALSFWVSKPGNGRREYVAVYTVNNFDGSGTPPQVQQVQVTSPQFKTAQGISTGQALPQIRGQFTTLKPLAYYLNEKNQQVYIYDDQAQGIAFEITVADSLCTAITIHQKGTDVTDTYLPVHPDLTRLE